jgi:hypothetical protein
VLRGRARTSVQGLRRDTSVFRCGQRSYPYHELMAEVCVWTLETAHRQCNRTRLILFRSCLLELPLPNECALCGCIGGCARVQPAAWNCERSFYCPISAKRAVLSKRCFDRYRDTAAIIDRRWVYHRCRRSICVRWRRLFLSERA